MKFSFIGLALCIFSLASFGAEYRAQVLQQYELLFSRNSQLELVREPSTSVDAVHRALSAFLKRKDLLPNGISSPAFLMQTHRRLLNIKTVAGATASQIELAAMKVKFELLQNYWLGYLTMLAAVEPGSEESLDNMSNVFYRRLLALDEFESLVKNNGSVTFSRRAKKILAKEIYNSFYVHYCLGVFFNKSLHVSQKMRRNAIAAWKTLDPKFSFLKNADRRYRYGFRKLHSQAPSFVLPASFAGVNADGDVVVTKQEFESNELIKVMFGPAPWTKERFRNGLKELKQYFPEKVIHLLHSLLQLDAAEKRSSFVSQEVMAFIDAISAKNKKDVMRYFGENASYKSAACGAFAPESLSIVAKEDLMDMVRQLRFQTKTLTEELIAQKNSLQAAHERHVASLQQRLDSLVKTADATLMRTKAAHLTNLKMQQDEFSEERTRMLKAHEVMKNSFKEAMACHLLAGRFESIAPVTDEIFSTFELNTSVSFKGNQEAISRMFRKRSVDFHPDMHVNKSAEDRKKFNDKFQNLSEQYNLLRNESSYNELIRHQLNTIKLCLNIVE